MSDSHEQMQTLLTNAHIAIECQGRGQPWKNTEALAHAPPILMLYPAMTVQYSEEHRDYRYQRDF